MQTGEVSRADPALGLNQSIKLKTITAQKWGGQFASVQLVSRAGQQTSVVNSEIKRMDRRKVLNDVGTLTEFWNYCDGNLIKQKIKNNSVDNLDRQQSMDRGSSINTSERSGKAKKIKAVTLQNL